MAAALLTLRGVYMDGKIMLLDEVPITGQHQVLVTFLSGGTLVYGGESGDAAGGQGLAPDQAPAGATRSEDEVVVSKERHSELLRHEAGLTPREVGVLEWIQCGMTCQEIADTLDLSRGTIRNYLSSVYKKLGVHNRVEAIRKAQELGILT